VLTTHRGVGTFVREASATQGTPARRDLDRDLRPLVDRLLAEAAVIGISLADVIRYLERLGSRPTSEN
jgi:hypothetical protein